MSRVEVFATGIKLSQAMKALLGGRSRDQGDLQTAEKKKKKKNARLECDL